MNINSIFKILNPRPKVGALEITDLDLKFIQIGNNRLASHSVKLASGAVKEGKIFDKKGFLDALANLRSQIVGKRKKEIYVIANIPDNNVYLQIFNLPAIAENNLDEAAKLNLRINSPIDFENAYSDWQLISKSQSNETNQFEIFGAFIQSQTIDDFDDCLRQEGFIPIAIEFGSLSLTRTAIDLGIEIDAKKPFILIYLNNNGLGFNLIKNSNLYFNHFISWQSVYSEEKQIPIEKFKKLIAEELKKVLNFYSARWQEPMEEIILATPGLEESISKIISENFSFKVKPLVLKKFQQDVPTGWFSTVGSALRGGIPWEKDIAINLSKIKIQGKLFQYKLKQFVEIWRNIILAASLAIVVIFIGADLFLRQTAANLEDRLFATVINPQEEQEKNRLLSEIQVINQQISLTSMAFDKRTVLSPFLEKMRKLSAASNVSLKRIFIQSWNTPVFINAFALNSEAALNFRDKLTADADFENIDLPIIKIISGDNGVNFTMSFKIKQIKK